MKRFVAIFLLLHLLSVNSFGVEVLRLPSLVHHFLEHEKEAGNLSFAGYLVAHYIQGEHLETDHSDENLPFKHNHDCCAHQSLVAIFLVPDENLKQLSLDPIAPVCISTEEHVTSSYCGSIFQPPRIT